MYLQGIQFTKNQRLKPILNKQTKNAVWQAIFSITSFNKFLEVLENI